ncbi:MAG: hypothetical protein ABI769_10520 [Pseudomonadota bacterium]
MNYISGRVVLKETGLGIPDLLVVIHDVDPDTKPEENIGTAGAPARTASATNETPNIGDRLGSRLTGPNGAFEFSYEDSEFQIRNPEEKRPDLLLLVEAPEEPGLIESSRVLYVSPEICQNAGRTEQRLIRISAETLKKAGVPLPLDPSVAKEESGAVIGKLNQAAVYRADIETATRKIAADQVAKVRAQHQQTAQQVQTKVIESLIGVTTADAKKLRIVMPGEKPEAMHYETMNQNIAELVNTAPLAGYLILTEEEAQPFRSGSGYRDHIPAAEIEPYIYKTGSETNRPSFLVREDPVAAICRSHESPDIFDEETGGGDIDETETPPATDDTPMELKDLPKFVGRLVNSLVPPNDTGGAKGRPTSDDVEKAIAGLQLKSGPADVPAFYDFHQLQIAFDFVWQHALDDGIIEATNQLANTLIENGGDPLPAVTNSSNPIKALKLEAQHVQLAQRSLQSTGVMYRAPAPSMPDATNPTPPPLPPKPPIIHPPFFDLTNAVLVDWKVDPQDPLGILENLINERYKFEVFAPGTTNFGLLVTYRQKWVPITYQVGDLVKTLTLAPKETRKVTSKRVIHKERSVKEMEANQRNRKDEINETMRSEAEIVQKAQDKNSFNTTSKGGYNVGYSSGEGTTNFTKEAEASSQETKKSFHEAVLKAAQEFKDERKVEVETKDTDESEYTDSAEISNPNDELTVTYLFYELQRRYRVSEHIHRLSPVVLVAMEVPNPNRASIDKMLLGHSWIINRVLLDDRYRPALDYLCTRIVGDELALRELANSVASVKDAVETLKKLHRDMENTKKAAELALDLAISRRADKVANENTEGVVEHAFESVFGSGSGEDVEAARIREDLKKDIYERAVRDEKDLRMRLDGEVAALTQAQAEYARANAEHSNRLLQIAGLRAHFKENVLYYMQAIWSFTFKDQIFFSLSSIKVPKLTAVQKTYSLAVPDELPLSITPKPGQIVLEVRADVQLNSTMDPAQDFLTLAEVADLDSPLGFKGNYMMFPLKQSNALTDFMMVPYIDSELGIHDPDDLGSWTPEDFAKYARCLQKQMKDELTEAEYAALQSQLEEQYKRIVSSPRLNNDEVIVPTSSLYIEALPGAHPLLEDFKLAHRLLDVKNAAIKNDMLKLECLRYAGRLLDGEYEDPEIERKIQINGAAPAIVVTPEA